MKVSKSSKPASRKRPPAKAEEPLPVGARSAEVVLDVDVERDRVHLVLANCGDAVATDVQVKFSRALVGLGGSMRISELPIFTKLGVLRPGRTVRIFWDAAPSLLSQKGQAAPFVATVSWSERSRGHQQAEYHHDLSIYRQMPVAVD
jgi:hypothetical protein